MNDEREHDLELLETHRRVIRKLRQKQARLGSSLPAADALEIEDHLEEIARIEKRWNIAGPDTEANGSLLSSSVPMEVLQFLPYLANRTAQKDSLHDILRRLDRRAPQPIVCIIHGDERQAQDMFLERLKKYILPDLLNVPQELSIMEYALSWPDRYATAKSFPSILVRRIAEAVQMSEDATLKDVNARLIAQMAPVLVSTFLLTQDWERHGVEGLRSFVRFWQQWPALSPGQVLVICLFVTYQVKRDAGFLTRWRSQRSNAELTQAVATLAHERFDGIIHCVLPPLEGVERGEVEHWARSTETRNICPRDEIISGIRSMYESWEKKERSTAMPMEDLAEQLRKLLNKYTGQGREFA